MNRTGRKQPTKARFYDVVHRAGQRLASKDVTASQRLRRIREEVLPGRTILVHRIAFRPFHKPIIKKHYCSLSYFDKLQ